MCFMIQSIDKKMNVDDTTYVTIRKIQLMEEKSPLLTKIDRNFYSEMLEHLENPDEMPEEEIQTIKRISDNIYEQREKKIMKVALSKARDGKPDLKNLLDAEKKLFDSALGILIQSRTRFFSKY